MRPPTILIWSNFGIPSGPVSKPGGEPVKFRATAASYRSGQQTELAFDIVGAPEADAIRENKYQHVLDCTRRQ